MRHLLSRIAVCAVALGAAPAWSQSLDDVLATVNGTDITLGQLLIARTQLPPQYQQLPAKDLFDGLMTQAVQQTLLAQTIDEQPARLALSIEYETRALMAGEALTQATDNAVSDEAIQKAYTETYVEGAPTREYNAAHILVATEEEALSIADELVGGADFAALAKQYSTGPSGPEGGNLGWFSAGMMVPEFEKAVVEMDLGTVSAPVKTQFGWHLIKLNEVRDKEPPALEEVRIELIERLRTEAIEAYLAELQDKAEITFAEGLEEQDGSLIEKMDLLKP